MGVTEQMPQSGPATVSSGASQCLSGEEKNNKFMICCLKIDRSRKTELAGVQRFTRNSLYMFEAYILLHM